MIFKVDPHKITKEEIDLVNEKELNITECEFVFSEEIPSNYVKEAYFTLNGNSYKVILIDNKCSIPAEVLSEKGMVEIGVIAYEVIGTEHIKRYNPSPVYITTMIGSMKDAQNSEEITPTDKEQITQMLENINLSVSKDGKITTISFTNTDGTTQTETLEDGMGLEFDWDGTSLGVKREDESSYEYVDLKGPRGEAGAIKFEIVEQLPTTGIKEDTIYLVPYATLVVQELPTTGTPHTIYIVESTNKRYVYESNQWIEITSDNKYIEYIYVNGQWEELGGIGVDVDLSDYYTKTETDTLLSGKQSTIDASHKLSSDLVDDTNKTNLFTNTTEKTTWNNKYDKPIAGIPKTDLDSSVQTSLGLADTSIQTETDPVFSASASASITTTDITTWNNKIDASALTNYVQNTDYATSSTGGVIKVANNYNTAMSSGSLYAQNNDYETYLTKGNGAFIGKGTLENVITGKDLTTKAYVDGLVGDINTALDTINGEVI